MKTTNQQTSSPLLQAKYKKVYEENYKEYKVKLEEFHERYPDAKELLKRLEHLLLYDVVIVYLSLQEHITHVCFIKLLVSTYHFATVYCKSNTVVMCVCLLFHRGTRTKRYESNYCLYMCCHICRLLLVIHVKPVTIEMCNHIMYFDGFSSSSHISFALLHFFIYNSSYKHTSKVYAYTVTIKCVKMLIPYIYALPKITSQQLQF